LVNNQWEENPRIPPLPEGVWLHCMVSLGNKKVMVIGGNYNMWAEGSLYSTKTYVLNESLVWSEGPPLNIARHWHSCGMIRRSASEGAFTHAVSACRKRSALSFAHTYLGLD
jgi:hypothetical protein